MLSNKITELQDFQREIEIEKNLLIEKAMNSSNPGDILMAQKILSQQPNGIEGAKSYILDPATYFNGQGFFEIPSLITNSQCRRMARTPVIRAIVGTRQDQVSKYENPVSDINKEGWMITKKNRLFDKDKELSDDDKKNIEFITKFILNGGTMNNKYSGDTFDDFLRKFVKDSLEIDQATFECVFSRGKKFVGFNATDGATYRFVDPSSTQGLEEVEGYLPHITQIYQGVPLTYFYPWELCMGIRNKSSNIYANGYGVSELEDLVKTVTYTIFSDEYNGKFFSQGAAPKGILSLAGNVSSAKLQDFKQQWRSTVAGVQNAWKTPVLEADKMNFIDLQKNNTDMQFQEWMQYLIATSCAVFKINPEEIGFKSDKGGQQLFGGNDEQRFEHSKQKGLLPLLKFVQRKMNKYIVEQLNDDYEFIFTGINKEDETAKADLNLKKMQTMPLNKYLEENNMKPIDGGDDTILNPTFLQWKQMQMYGNPESNEAVDGQEEDDTEKAENDPILKAYGDYMERLSRD